MSFVPSRSPLPASPTRGEVLHLALGTISPKSPDQHLPLDGGGWEGVWGAPVCKGALK